MTDFVLPIWLMLSWLVRQIETGIDTEEEEPEGSETEVIEEPAMEVDSEPFEPVEQIIKIAIAAFSALLLGLSISAYRKTALKGIVYAAIAFGLFAVQLLFDYAEDAVEGWEQPYNDVIFYTMTLAILVLFFMAVVRRNRT
jgi:hypothetical protein